MKLVLSVVGLGSLGLLAFTSRPPVASQQVQTEVVTVRCPAGNNPASVSPDTVRVSVGDNVEWRVTGPAASDSIRISLKRPGQAWPFTGSLPSGTTSARANGARTTGTYPYNIHLLCRQPGGGSAPVTIDPDIIVEE